MNTTAVTAVPFLPRVRYIEARWYRRTQRRNPPLWIVLHATDGVEGPRKAEDGAIELAGLPDNARKRSVHWFVDSDSIVQCVPVECEAWHAGRNANQYGEGIELCGRVSQTREQWLDRDSLPMLALAARLVRARADQLSIPLRFLTATQVRAKMTGITTHAEISRAFPADTTHTDPGAGFPLEDFMAAVRSAA